MDKRYSGSLNKGFEGKKNFLEHLQDMLNLEKQDLENHFENNLDEFSRERFNSMHIPEKDTGTALRILEGEEYSERSGTDVFSQKKNHI